MNPGAPTIFLGLCLFSLLNAGAHAELHDRGAGLIYDDVLDVTWLQNVTLAAGSSYDDDYTKTPSPNPNTDGLLSYANAVAWAENLKYYDSVRGITWDDWRLPKVRPVNGTSFNLKSAYDGSTDVGYNITSPTHELAYMYYVNLKNKGQYDTAGVKQTGYGLVDDPDDPNDESLFINLRNGIFWYGTRRPEGFNPNNAWDLRARYGNDLASDSRYVRYAWAVRDGDVGFAAPIQISQISATPASLLDTETSQLAVTANDPEPGPSELTYQWSVIAGGGTFDNASIASPTYTPEDVSDSQTVTIEVEVSDGENSVRRTLALQVSDGNVPLPNSAPQITGVSATPTSLLDTELSNLAVIASDPDNGPQSLSYQWIIVTGGGVLDDATSATPVFTPADVTGSQTVTLRVTVSDGAASASQDVALNVQDADPPAPGVELLAQDFSGTTLTDWLATDEGSISAPSKWRVASGELAQLSNIRDGGTANALPHLGTFLTYQGGLDWTDYRAKFRLRSADDDTLGLMFRVQDNDNYYRFSWDKSLNQRRLVKRVGGLFTELAADNVPYVVGQTYQLEMVAQGSQLEVWIDGVRIFQVTDGALDHGTIAFYTWQNNAAYFDELKADSIN